MIEIECEPAVGAAYRETRAIMRELSRAAGTDVDTAPFFAAGAQLYGPWVAARHAAFGAFVDAQPDSVEPVLARIVRAGAAVPGTDVFAAQNELMALQRAVEHTFTDVDVVVVPTIPFLPTLAEVAADPIGVNGRLSRFTDFVNLLDLCAVAVPGAARRDGLPFGVTVIGPAGADPLVADVAARLHAAVGGTLGATSIPVPTEPWPDGLPGLGGAARVAVVGAHLRGLPLHHELAGLSARLDAPAGPRRTTGSTRCRALFPRSRGWYATTAPAPRSRWSCTRSTEAELGRFLGGVAAPLAIGPVELDDGAWVPGFLAAAGALDSAIDITHHGGWRTYMDSRRLE